MVEKPRLPIPVRYEIAKFMNRIQKADIPKEDKHQLFLLVAEMRKDFIHVHNVEAT